jgi:hypothetical protein
MSTVCESTITPISDEEVSCRGWSCWNDVECQGSIHHHHRNVCTDKKGWCCFEHAFLHGDLRDYENELDKGTGYYGESF